MTTYLQETPLPDCPYIYRNYTTMTVPIIDGIDHETFEYKPVYEERS